MPILPSPQLVIIFSEPISNLPLITVHKAEFESNDSSGCLSITLSAATSDNCSHVNEFTPILYQELASAENTILTSFWTYEKG
jgi:hypothetical protein